MLFYVKVQKNLNFMKMIDELIIIRKIHILLFLNMITQIKHWTLKQDGSYNDINIINNQDIKHEI
jgi:hypothetical protein